MISSLVATLLVGAAGAPATVHYVTKVETVTWQPLALVEVEKMVETAALVPLSAAGTWRFVRTGFAELGKGDYSLMIDGRYVEEAELFSVYVTFGVGQRKDLPSFHVSETEAIGKRSRTEMQKVIEGLATRASARLAALLEPLVLSQRAGAQLTPLETGPMPWSWGPIEQPQMSASEAPAHLRAVITFSNPDHERANAIREVAPYAVDRPAAREALELCALRDPVATHRESCVRALAPVARTRIATQRLLLHAMRSEMDEKVLKQLAEVSKAFVGLSRKEAIETWLELLASEATPAEAVGVIAALVAKEGDVPNLDLAVTRCLQQESLASQKKFECARYPLGQIPPERRERVVWRYLQNVAAWGSWDLMAFERVIEAVAGRGDAPIGAPLADLFFDIASRPSAGRARWHAVIQASRHPAPTARHIERLLPVAREPHLLERTLHALCDLVERSPELAPVMRAGLQRVRDTTAYLAPPNATDPNAELADILDPSCGARRSRYRRCTCGLTKEVAPAPPAAGLAEPARGAPEPRPPEVVEPRAPEPVVESAGPPAFALSLIPTLSSELAAERSGRLALGLGAHVWLVRPEPTGWATLSLFVEPQLRLERRELIGVQLEDEQWRVLAGLRGLVPFVIGKGGGEGWPVALVGEAAGFAGTDYSGGAIGAGLSLYSKGGSSYVSLLYRGALHSSGARHSIGLDVLALDL